jgi:manganese efflux pump family protein
MPNIFPIILLGLSVGLGNFAAAIAIGLSGVNRSVRIKVTIVFGLFETLMPIVGLVIGKRLASQIGGNANLIGGSLLVLTGLYIIYGSFKKSEKSSKKSKIPTNQGNLKLIFAGLALSVDNLIVGFSLGTQNAPLLTSAIIIGASSVALALVGLEIGSRLSNKIGDYSEIFSGLILVLVGILVGLKVI